MNILLRTIMMGGIDGIITIFNIISSIEGTKFLSQGCSVRLSCPISKKIKRDPTQSEYHMSVFKAS